MVIPLSWTAVQLWSFAVHLSIDPQPVWPYHRICPEKRHTEISDKCTAASDSISTQKQRKSLGENVVMWWFCPKRHDGVSALSFLAAFEKTISHRFLWALFPQDTETEEVVSQPQTLKMSPLFKRRILHVSRIFVFFNVGIVVFLLGNLQV